jgi:hypothetical protein
LISEALPSTRPPDEHANTAKLSSLLLNRTSRLSFAGDPRARQSDSPSTYANMSLSAAKDARRRRSSSLVYKEPPESLEQLSDQEALPNLNANWVNSKGEHFDTAYGIHSSSAHWMPCCGTLHED